MKFGAVNLSEAKGAILAHSIKTTSGRLRKGAVLGADEISRLQASGVAQVTVAQLEAGDINENDAALQLAQAIVPDADMAGLTLSQAFTGRVNLIAASAGVLKIDAAAIDALNSVHPMITCATVLPHARMEVGSLAATIKIISYAVPGEALNKACAAGANAMQLAAVKLKTVELLVTDTGSGPDDTKGIMAIDQRLERLNMTLSKTTNVAHEVGALSRVIAASQADLILILTASATSDPEDTAPSALNLAGGTLTRFGMPVDPGNLLFLGDIKGKPVIGLPGCARSPALNGADWVLERIACGLEITSQDISAMGVGGLLKEIPQRPQPRRG